MDLVSLLKALPIAGYVFFGLFVAASIVQIVLAALDKEKARRIEKTFCLLMLLVFAIICVPTFPLLYIGVFLGMIGDLLLAFRKKMLFYIGSFSFGFSHLFYLASLIVILGSSMMWWIYIVAGVICVIFYLVTTNIVGHKLGKNGFEKYTMMGYFTILLFNFIVMIASLMVHPLYLFLTAIGGFMFIISDSLIVYNQFYKPIKHAEVFVMSTYLIAQAFIVLGIVFTLITL